MKPIVLTLEKLTEICSKLPDAIKWSYEQGNRPYVVNIPEKRRLSMEDLNTPVGSIKMTTIMFFVELSEERRELIWKPSIDIIIKKVD